VGVHRRGGFPGAVLAAVAVVTCPVVIVKPAV